MVFANSSIAHLRTSAQNQRRMRAAKAMLIALAIPITLVCAYLLGAGADISESWGGDGPGGAPIWFAGAVLVGLEVGWLIATIRRG
jgi:hypothetical protein